MEMYNTLEGVIVNGQLPQKYQQKLVTKKDFEKTTLNCESYRNGSNKGSGRSATIQDKN